MFEHQRAIRDGLALLAGLLRCGRCGRRICVGYKARSALYYCDGGPPKGWRRCVSFGSKAIDEKVAGEVVRALSPLALEASLVAEQELQGQQEQECENARLRVQASQYEVDRAFEQFDAVDPKNRLVADLLEGRLNEKLAQLDEAKRHLEGLEVRRTTLDEKQRRQLVELAEDFPSLWNHPDANATLKKRILRTVLEEVIVTHDVDRSELDVVLHWKGGVHTMVRVAGAGPG